MAPGLPTGQMSSTGEKRYFMGFWETPSRLSPGGSGFYPSMIGYGGNIVSLPEPDIITIRLARSTKEGGPEDDTSGMARVAKKLARP